MTASASALIPMTMMEGTANVLKIVFATYRGRELGMDIARTISKHRHTTTIICPTDIRRSPGSDPANIAADSIPVLNVTPPTNVISDPLCSIESAAEGPRHE
ncbi:hypothetical protein StoSoilB13_19740 [Arthrobacter sp. StoSoilB13]|nr:hypothetical protein StoSoilB13_19740 [Arthrobacter sp. StoSoilB13]